MGFLKKDWIRLIGWKGIIEKGMWGKGFIYT